MKHTTALDELTAALKCLPGIGPKAAQRMTYHLLQRNRTGALKLAFALQRALEILKHCGQCNTFSEEEICSRCASPKRDRSMLCIVEMPADLAMIEQTQSYPGMYYVLMGRLSPMDGITPSDMNLQKLAQRVEDEQLKEVIIATNFTCEGEATAHMLQTLLQNKGLRISRLSRGVPVGGELENTDSGTIAQSLLDRRFLS